MGTNCPADRNLGLGRVWEASRAGGEGGGWLGALIQHLTALADWRTGGRGNHRCGRGPSSPTRCPVHQQGLGAIAAAGASCEEGGAVGDRVHPWEAHLGVLAAGPLARMEAFGSRGTEVGVMGEGSEISGRWDEYAPQPLPQHTPLSGPSFSYSTMGPGLEMGYKGVQALLHNFEKKGFQKGYLSIREIATQLHKSSAFAIKLTELIQQKYSNDVIEEKHPKTKQIKTRKCFSPAIKKI